MNAVKFEKFKNKFVVKCLFRLLSTYNVSISEKYYDYYHMYKSSQFDIILTLKGDCTIDCCIDKDLRTI